jgi:hypothetical protein
MRKALATHVLTTAGLAAAVLLAGCAESRIRNPVWSTLRIDPDFGSATRADFAAQIANPEPHYAGSPAPGSDGERTGLAQARYAVDRVIPPATASTSDIQFSNDNSSNGGSGGGSAAPAMPLN